MVHGYITVKHTAVTWRFNICNTEPSTVTRSAFDNDACHVTAFRPISEAEVCVTATETDLAHVILVDIWFFPCWRRLTGGTWWCTSSISPCTLVLFLQLLLMYNTSTSLHMPSTSTKYVTSYTNQLSLLTHARQKICTSQSDALRLASKDKYASFHLWISVCVEGKTIWSLITTYCTLVL